MLVTPRTLSTVCVRFEVECPIHLDYYSPSMKILHRTLAMLLTGMTALTLLPACSKSSAPSTNVDVSAQTEQLKSPEVNARADAASALALAGPKAAPAIPALIEALKDSDPLVRRLSAYALGQIGPAAKEAIQPLTTAMQQGEREMITASMNAIRAIDPTALPEGNIPNIQPRTDPAVQGCRPATPAASPWYTWTAVFTEGGAKDSVSPAGQVMVNDSIRSAVPRPKVIGKFGLRKITAGGHDVPGLGDARRP